MNKEKFKKISKKIFHSYYWLLVLIVIIDQVTKALAVHFLTLGSEVQVIKNFFYFRLTFNTGAAWSFLAGHTVVLMLISIAAAAVIIAYRIVRRNMLHTNHKIIAALITGGTIGNLIDRMLTVFHTYEGVVDFLSFDFGSYHFPIFNFADMMLVIGVIYLLILIIFTPEKDKEKQGEPLKQLEGESKVKIEDAAEVIDHEDDHNKKDLDDNEL